MVDKKKKKGKKRAQNRQKTEKKYVDAEVQCLINNSVP
jgi:hypothetical protein